MSAGLTPTRPAGKKFVGVPRIGDDISLPVEPKNEESPFLTSAFFLPTFRRMGFDATRKLPGENYHRKWPELVKMTDVAQRLVDRLRSNNGDLLAVHVTALRRARL